MFVIEDLRSETIDDKVKMYIDPDSTIKSDDSKSYINFSKIVKEHIHQAIEPKQGNRQLLTVRRARFFEFFQLAFCFCKNSLQLLKSQIRNRIHPYLVGSLSLGELIINGLQSLVLATI